MKLEERSIEQLPDRCQSCGAPLTEGEKKTALESAAEQVLCTICAAEELPTVEDDVEPGPGY